MGESEGGNKGWEEVEKGAKFQGEHICSATSLEKKGDMGLKMVKAGEEYRIIFKMKELFAGGFKGVNPLKLGSH